MNKTAICDYTHYDYEKEFWKNTNREYEHLLETTVIFELLSTYCNHHTSILDAGCGYGRLFNAYSSLFSTFYLVDFAQQLLDKAKKNIPQTYNVIYQKNSLYNHLFDEKIDVILSIRTLHHLNDIDTLFNRFSKQLSDNGILLLDIPNYYHLKNKLKSPISKRQPMTALSDTFFNYDPHFIIEKLTKSGFNIVDTRQVGLFRIGWIKRHVPPHVLVRVEKWVNRLLKNSHIGPSVYVVAKKCG